jgi:hypothetical protein
VHKALVDVRTCLHGRVEVLTVDKKPVARSRSRIVTVVPMVPADPGPHAFQVWMGAAGNGVPGETLLVAGAVIAGKRYRFEAVAATFRLVRTRAGE